MDKARSASISLPESYWGKLQALADDSYGGNRTKAIKSLLDAQPQAPDPKAADPLIQLAYTYADHETIDHIEDGIDRLNINQAHFLSHMLREIGKALHRTQDSEDWHGMWVAPPHLHSHQDQYDIALKAAEDEGHYSRTPPNHADDAAS